MTQENKVKLGEQVAAIRLQSKAEIEAALNKLGKLEVAIYNYMLHNAFVDDGIKQLIRQYDEQLKNGNGETVDFLMLKSWVKGVFDGFRGLQHISNDANLQAFVKNVLEAADVDLLILTHIEVLRVYVTTEAKIKEVANANKQPS